MPQMHDQRMLLDELAYNAWKAGILSLEQIEIWFGLRKPVRVQDSLKQERK